MIGLLEHQLLSLFVHDSVNDKARREIHLHPGWQGTADRAIELIHRETELVTDLPENQARVLF